MLVTDSFVFLHIPKTAGSFIQTVLPDHLPVIKYSYRVWTHTSYEELPERWRHLPAFCVVRNPWDWYVSWFCYTMEGRSRRDARLRSPNADPRKRVVWEHVFRSGRADFKEAVTRACAGGFDHPLAPLMREKDIDLYSAHVQSIAGGALDRPDFSALRFERLDKQLVRFLGRYVEVTPALRRAIRRGPPIKASEHGPYPDYYDDGLRDLVGEKARWLCERFQYTYSS